jgi:hypothetical protein
MTQPRIGQWCEGRWTDLVEGELLGEQGDHDGALDQGQRGADAGARAEAEGEVALAGRLTADALAWWHQGHRMIS